MSKCKNPASDENVNSDFCDMLIKLAEHEKNINNHIHKHNAYRKAASVLAAHPKRIESGDEAKKLSGIGKIISNQIDEFIQTGKLSKLENIQNDKDAQAISLLTRVSGIGPATAEKLVRNGIKTIGDLEKYIDNLNHHQKIGLKYFEDFEKKIPREETLEIEGMLKTLINKLDPQFTLTICGSYRRGKLHSSDIDALVTLPSFEEKQDKKSVLKKLVDALSGLVTEVISMGDTDFMGVCRVSSKLPARLLHIRLTPSEQYHCAVLHLTGSDVFNKMMRAHALKKGFTLNQYELRRFGVTGVPGEAVPIKSEEDIFNYIGFPYKTPEERNM